MLNRVEGGLRSRKKHARLDLIRKKKISREEGRFSGGPHKDGRCYEEMNRSELAKREGMLYAESFRAGEGGQTFHRGGKDLPHDDRGGGLENDESWGKGHTGGKRMESINKLGVSLEVLRECEGAD